ncbi:AraC family transcriptional regulator [Paenibacillus cymbidii]|uniref:AraC family transcriptional regulator n=1 Tax=Paenibacillus cymbidii TaxID=1639034 RepID=UPI0010821E42|nr:AraC family transcriptional regulator [Paenibacillus cymbidii]
MAISLSPYIRFASDSVIQSPWYMRERDLWDYEFLYLMEGEIVVTIAGHACCGVPGDLFILRPGRRHTIRSVGETTVRQPNVHFDLVERPDSRDVTISFLRKEEMSAAEIGWFREDLLSAGPFELPDHMRLRHPAVFEKLLFALIAEYRMKLPFAKLRMQGHFLNLFAYLLREYEWGRTPLVRDKMPLLLQVEQYLNHHDADISLDELSNKFHISKFYLARLFQNAFGMSPIRYHQLARLEKAKQLLRFTELPIQQIAYQLGFSSIHDFSRAFKKQEGVAPSHYRRAY